MRRLLLVLTLATAAAPTLSAQRRGPVGDAVPLEGYKDPQLATVLGLILPGGGQIYAGREVKGGILLTLGVAAPLTGLLIAAAMRNDCCRRGEQGFQASDGGFGNTTTRFDRGGRDDARWVPVAAGFGVSALSWAYGWATASSDARRANQGSRSRRVGAIVKPIDGGGTGLGLQFALP